ncbi:MAG: phosphotransferase [Mycobacteriales bacterium]
MNRDAVEQWLSRHLGPLTVAHLTQVSRGVSRETWSVDVIQGGRRRELVIRRDHASGSVIPTPLRVEHDVYRALTGLPVAEVLLWDDAGPEGRPAYVRERVDGDWRLPVLASDDPADDDERIRLSRAHLEALAAVHAHDWRALRRVLPCPPSAAQAAEHLVTTTRGLVEQLLAEPLPVLAMACAALLARAPRDLPALALCKGTNGLGEEVWSGGRLVALSDWELARIGDPAYDLAQVQDMVPTINRDGRQLWDWGQALDHYNSVAPHPVTQERLQWYRDCYGLLQLSYAANAAAHARSGSSLRFAWTGYEIAYHAERRLAALC